MMVLFWPMPVVVWMPSCETVTGLASQWSEGGVGWSDCMAGCWMLDAGS